MAQNLLGSRLSLPKHAEILHVISIEQLPEDERSCWISTTRSLRWAIWEVARRWANDTSITVNLTVKSSSPHPNKSRMAADAATCVYRCFALSRRTRRLPSLLSDTTLRCDATAALQRAEDSYETVYYGRIFPSSIKAKLRWTAMVSTSDDKKESG